MAVIHFTVVEVRAMLKEVTPAYQAQSDSLAEDYKRSLERWKAKRDAARKERDEEPARRERKLRADARDDYRKQERGRDDHPIRSFFGGKWKTEEEFYEERKRTTLFHSPYCWGMDLMMPPEFPEHTRLTFCTDLANKLMGYENNRVIGLHPHELEILKPNENTTQLGTTTDV